MLLELKKVHEALLKEKDERNRRAELGDLKLTTTRRTKALAPHPIPGDHHTSIIIHH